MNIPYVFKPGTAAKAAEVNTNFTEIKKAVDSLEDNEAIFQSTLDKKADINGSISVLFDVAPPLNQNNAVNLSYLEQAIEVARNIVVGATISYLDNVITVTSGQALPSTGSTTIYAGTQQIDISPYTIGKEYYIFMVQPKGDTGTYKVTDNHYSSFGGDYKLVGSFIRETDTTLSSLTMIGTRVNANEVINVLQ